MNAKDEFVYRIKRAFRKKTLQSLRKKKSYGQFDIHKCIFIHIPKTAGISVAHSLFGHRIGHLSALNYAAMFGKNDFNNYFKFAFVRNPFMRLISAYEFMQSGGYGPVDQKIVSIVRQYKSLEDFVLQYLTPAKAKAIRHFRPQHYYVCDSNDRIMINYWGKFEDLEREYDYVRQKIRAGEPLRKLNVTKTKKLSVQEYYSNTQVVEKVISIYRKDFELFGYPMEIPPSS